MRSARRATTLGFLCLSALAACGGNTSPERGDAGASSRPGVVSCGASTCDVARGEGCCTTSTSSPGPSPSCAAACPAGNLLRCDGAEDCPGQKCCSRRLANGLSEAKCSDDCPNGAGLQICHADAECVGTSAPGATKCCPLNANGYPGVGVCDARSGQFCGG